MYRVFLCHNNLLVTTGLKTGLGHETLMAETKTRPRCQPPKTETRLRHWQFLC